MVMTVLLMIMASTFLSGLESMSWMRVQAPGAAVPGSGFQTPACDVGLITNIMLRYS